MASGTSVLCLLDVVCLRSKVLNKLATVSLKYSATRSYNTTVCCQYLLLLTVICMFVWCLLVNIVVNQSADRRRFVTGLVFKM